MTRSTTSIPRPGLFIWWTHGARLLARDVRRHRRLFALIAAIWALALMRIFVHHVPVLPVMFNWTTSLPYRVVYVDYWPGPLRRGDLVVYRFNGEAAQHDYPGLKGQALFKRIVGMPGDTISVVDRDVFINGVPAGHAKTYTFDRKPLQPISAGSIPAGFFYVQGTSPDSFDSRYRSSGLVAQSDVQARVRPVF